MRDPTERRPTLAWLLSLYWHVEAAGPDFPFELRSELERLRPDIAVAFREELAAAIRERDVTLRDLERWTALALDEDDEVHAELLAVWAATYDEPPPQPAE